MPRSRGRTGRPWRRAAAAVRDRVRAGAPCWLCGQPIDLSLPARHPRGFSVDHVIPLQHNGPELDPANLRPAHIGCNSRRSGQSRSRSRQPPPAPPRPFLHLDDW